MFTSFIGHISCAESACSSFYRRGLNMATLVSYEDSDESETEDASQVEQEEKQKPSSLSAAYKQEIRSLVSVIPGNEDGGRGKVKIALPQPKKRHVILILTRIACYDCYCCRMMLMMMIMILNQLLP